MALMKQVADEIGNVVEVPMSQEEEATFLASLPATRETVPASITRRQCAKRMLVMGLIQPSEALAMTQSGTPPAMVMTAINAMPEGDRVNAQIDFAADTYLRANPLLEGLMLATGATNDDIDQFFRLAAQL